LGNERVHAIKNRTTSGIWPGGFEKYFKKTRNAPTAIASPLARYNHRESLMRILVDKKTPIMKTITQTLSALFLTIAAISFTGCISVQRDEPSRVSTTTTTTPVSSTTVQRTTTVD